MNSYYYPDHQKRSINHKLLGAIYFQRHKIAQLNWEGSEKVIPFLQGRLNKAQAIIISCTHFSYREIWRVLVYQPTKAHGKWNIVNYKIKTNEVAVLAVCGEGKAKRARAGDKAWKEGERVRLSGRKIEIVQGGDLLL